MILQARYLFILCYSYLIYLARAPLISQCSSSGTEENEIKQISLIKMATPSLIINDVSKRYEDYHHSNNDHLSKMKIFMKDMIESANFENIVKMTFVVYVAFEYWYSLTLCVIWNRTTEDIPEEILNQILFLKELKQDSILEECSKTLQPFYNLVQTYLIIINEIQNSENSRRKLSRDSICPFITLMSNLKSCIHSMNNYSQVERHFKFTWRDAEHLRDILYRSFGAHTSACVNTLRSYFDKTNIDIGTPTFQANIPISSFINEANENKAKIYHDEQFLWRNVVNIFRLNEVSQLNDLLILLKCEEFRYEVKLYMTGRISQIYPATVQRQYMYSNFEIIVNNNCFTISFP